ncbi:hypothetical protein AAC387_Pa09g1206 [Persea americana]
MANHPWGMPDIPTISAPGATRAIGEAYFPPLDTEISRSLSTPLSEPRYSPRISGSPIVERVPSPMNAVVARKSHSSPPTPIRRDSYSADSRVTYKDLVGSSKQTVEHKTYANITTRARRVLQPIASQVIHHSATVTRAEPITSMVPQYRAPFDTSIVTTTRQARQQPAPIPYANTCLHIGQGQVGPTRSLTPRVPRRSPAVYTSAQNAPIIDHQYRHEVVRPQLQTMTPPTVSVSRSIPNSSSLRLTYHQPTGYERSPLTYQDQLTPAYEMLDEEQDPPLYYDEVADDVDPNELHKEHRPDHPAHELSGQYA